MSEFPPLIYCDLIEEQPQTREQYDRKRACTTEAQHARYVAKFQPWRWVAIQSRGLPALHRVALRVG